MVDDLTRTEREQRWLACYKQRAEARRRRFEAAEACCACCARTGNTDPLDRATYHRRQAETRTIEAEARAVESARAALRFRRATIVTTAALAAVAVLTLALSLTRLLGGGE
jgi:CHASE3 domain sensor protein